MTELVQTSLADGVFTITLADEERRNALSSEMLKQLNAACDRADDDPGVRVVVMTNHGTTFCAGADLREGKPESSPAHRLGEQPIFARFARSPKPYVGRIAGHAVAGGLGLVAAMDISIATTEARFGFTEVRIGVAPALISVVCLPKMRLPDARVAMLTGRRFSATEAASMGLINAAVSCDELDTEVQAIVADVLQGSPNALAATKEVLRQVPNMGTESAFTWTSLLSAELFRGPDAREGIASYLEKRAPAWAPR